MKIAIVAPSPVPYTPGGAEAVWRGLFAAIQEHTPHECELLKLPIRERTLPEVVHAYSAFAGLDVAHFDAVVTGKYPAWMIRHHDHRLWMLHPLRGLYDTYWRTGQPERIEYREPCLAALQAILRGGATAGRIFSAFAEVLAELGGSHPALALPGPLARELVHALDAAAMSRERVRHHLSMSATVARRRDYFPPGVTPRIVHPPSDLTGLHCRKFDYFFTASRLDAPKRLDLLITAFRQVRTARTLRIAGTGPEEAHLRELAADDHRIEFLGHVARAELTQLYADAIAVPFVPLDEDWGLITVEAMQSGKPVITCRDSGGPNELVVDGINGLVTISEPAPLAAAIQRLADDATLCKRLGERGRLRAATITWEHFARAVAGAGADRAFSTTPRRRRRSSRGHLVVASTYPIANPQSGGALRCFNLYQGLSAHGDVEVVSLGQCGAPLEVREISDTMVESVVAIPDRLLVEAGQRWGDMGMPIGDIIVAACPDQLGEYRHALARALVDARGVILAHPYLHTAVRAAAPGLPVVYDSHNAEWRMKRALLPATPAGAELAAIVRDVEAAAMRDAVLVTACSQADADSLLVDFGGDPARMVVIPNGVDLQQTSFSTAVERAGRRQRWLATLASARPAGCDRVAVFLASEHPPNVEAVRSIIAMAPGLPSVLFVVGGSVCRVFETWALPANVLLLGIISDFTKRQLLGFADVALNPMGSGGGTNLKLLEYLAAGVPAVSSPIGARGLGRVAAEVLIEAPIAKFPTAVKHLLEGGGDQTAMLTRARLLMEAEYGWPDLGARFVAAVQAALPPIRAGAPDVPC